MHAMTNVTLIIHNIQLSRLQYITASKSIYLKHLKNIELNAHNTLINARQFYCQLFLVHHMILEEINKNI